MKKYPKRKTKVICKQLTDIEKQVWDKYRKCKVFTQESEKEQEVPNEHAGMSPDENGGRGEEYDDPANKVNLEVHIDLKKKEKFVNDLESLQDKFEEILCMDLTQKQRKAVRGYKNNGLEFFGSLYEKKPFDRSIETEIYPDCVDDKSLPLNPE